MPQPFCELLPSDVIDTQVPDDKVPAVVAPNMLWPTGQDVLYVYIMNPDELKAVDVNEQNILSWAKTWKHSDIPKFQHTNDLSKANIRIKIGKLT